jgi:protein-S-isoprenylcysteine O-methyltransferase Ste14
MHLNSTMKTNPCQMTKADPDQSTPKPDSPGVIVFPPLLLVGAAISRIGLQLIWPVHLITGLSFRVLGAIMILAGAMSIVSAKWAMKRAGTNVHPSRPTTNVVTEGPYRFTRNPIYLGGMSVFLGFTLGFNALWPMITLIPFLALMHFGVVRREERYLDAKFGDTYRNYRAQVRRWL